MRRRAGGFFLALKIKSHGAFFELVIFRLLELTTFDHLRHHGVASVQGAIGVDHRVVVGIALEHADQRGAFQHRELRGRFIEIGTRRHLNAKGVVEKRHGVEIGFENLFLGIERFNLEGRNRFFEFAVQIARPPDLGWIEVARQLLGNGRAALRVAVERVNDRTHGAREVHAVVLIKAVVFRGYQCLDDRGRNFFQRHPLAVTAFELGNLLAVGAENLGWLLQFGLAQITDAGREGDQQQHIQHKQQGQGGEQQQPFAPGGPALPPGQGGNALAGPLPGLRVVHALPSLRVAHALPYRPATQALHRPGHQQALPKALGAQLELVFEIVR